MLFLHTFILQKKLENSEKTNSLVVKLHYTGCTNTNIVNHWPWLYLIKIPELNAEDSCLFTFSSSVVLVFKVFSSLEDSYQHFCIHASFPTWKHVPPSLFHKISVLWFMPIPHLLSNFLFAMLSRDIWEEVGEHTTNLQQVHRILRRRPIQTEKQCSY